MNLDARKIAALLIGTALVAGSFSSVAFANQSGDGQGDNTPTCTDNQTLIEGQCVDNQDNGGDQGDNHRDSNHGDNHGDNDHGDSNGHGHDGHQGDNGDGGNTPPPVYVPLTGGLSIIKVVVGGTATPDQFSFSFDGVASTTFNASGENDFFAIATGTYNIFETASSTYTTAYSNCQGLLVAANATSTCTITNTFVPPAPVVPTCSETQTLVNNVCVDNAPAPTTPTPTVTTTTDGGNGGGHGGGIYVGSGSDFLPGGHGGVVLGTSTEDTASTSTSCSPLISTFMRQGKHNDKDEVTKLQNFLNTELGSRIPVTGFFGPETTASVNQFQSKYDKDVLDPWTPFGLSHKPTGYVYKTTQRQINRLFCSTLNLPFPQLP